MKKKKREELLNIPSRVFLPGVLDWTAHANSSPIHSIYNTPPIYPIYLHGLVMKDLISQGGIEFIEKRAISRAKKIYDLIDNSGGYYFNVVKNKDHRSRMSVPCTIGEDQVNRNKSLELLFVKSASERNLLQLFGHPVKGGLRFTLYNGIPDESVDRLIQFLKEFKEKNPL